MRQMHKSRRLRIIAVVIGLAITAGIGLCQIQPSGRKAGVIRFDPRRERSRRRGSGRDPAIDPVRTHRRRCSRRRDLVRSSARVSDGRAGSRAALRQTISSSDSDDTSSSTQPLSVDCTQCFVPRSARW